MNAEKEGKARAEAFRAEHGLGYAPLPDLVSLIELTQDIDVAVLAAEPEEHGLSVRDPARDVVVVAVALTANPMRQRSTLAHELGHVLFGDFGPPGDWDRRTPEERRADSFARHLLVPLEGIEAVLADRHPAGAVPAGEGVPQRAGLPDLSTVVQRFKASPALVAIQLHEGGWISSAQKSEWAGWWTPNLAARFGWSDLYQGWQQESQTRRAPQRLLSRATQGYVANVVSLPAIARLRGLPVEQIAAEFEEAGIFPEPVEPMAAPVASANLRPDTDFGDLDVLDDKTGSTRRAARAESE